MAHSVKCLFCFKTIDGEDGITNNDTLGKTRDTTAKFFKFLQRHLNSKIHHVNQEFMASLLITGSVTSDDSSFDINSCLDCNQMMSNFLDLYNQLKLIELKVNWAINRMASVMSIATKCPSRVDAFNDSVKIRKDNNCDESIYGNIQLDEITAFRNDLITKCNQYYNGLLPRVTLNRRNTNLTIKQTIRRGKEACSKIFKSHVPISKNGSYASVNMTPSHSVISFLLITVLANCVLQLLSSLPRKNYKKSVQIVKIDSTKVKVQNVTEAEIVVIEDNQESNPNSEHEPCPSVSDSRSPISNDEEEFETEADPVESSPIEIINEETEILTSNTSDNNRRTLRARKRFWCNECSESFSTPSALLDHQQTSHTYEDPLGITDDEDDEIGDEQDLDPDYEESEEIIQQDTNFQSEINQGQTIGQQKFLLANARDYHGRNGSFKTDEEHDITCIKTIPRIFCNNCSESFPTHAALLNHQQKSHTKFNPCGDQEISGRNQTEERIIQIYANNQFEFVQTRKTDRGKFVSVGAYVKGGTINNTEERDDAPIKTLSQYLSPTQQRLAAALLHRPNSLCNITSCSERFVFEDQLESHSKLHGEFACSLCSHVEAYAPKLAEHVLTEHCSTTSSNVAVGTFVSCPILTCGSSAPRVEFFDKHYVFHYLTEHLNLDVSCIGCPICHHSNRVGALARHKHFQNFHGIFNMTPEDVRQCESCPAFFCTTSKLFLHMFRFHNQFPTSCPDCKNTFVGRNWYSEHSKKCKRQTKSLEKHRCSFPNCDKAFGSSSNLIAHRRYCTFKPGEVWHNCSKCSKRFRRKTQLKRHLEAHKPEIRKCNTAHDVPGKKDGHKEICGIPESKTDFKPEVDSCSRTEDIDSECGDEHSSRDEKDEATLTTSNTIKRKKKATDDRDSGKTEDEIIHHYANARLEFVRKNKNDQGKIFVRALTKATNHTNPTENISDVIITNLSQCLSPAQQRLSAALLHPPRFSCEIHECNEKFVFEDHFQSHSKLHGEFSCGLCSHVEEYAPKLADHVLTNHCSTKSRNISHGSFMSCPMLPCASSSPPLEIFERNYVFHYLTEHLNLDVSSIGCLICHYVSPNRSYSTNYHNHFQHFHMVVKMKAEDVHQCESCAGFFWTSSKLNMHKLAFHNQVPASCLDCGKIFEGKRSYIAHISKCKEKNKDLFKHRCSFPNCDKPFERLCHLVWHMKNCTMNPEGIWHDCSKCKRRFREEEKLQRHLERHKREKEKLRQYQRTNRRICELCGKSILAVGWQSHQKCHAGPDTWTHECPECGLKCMNQGKLNWHMRVHTKAVSFVCQFCGTKYAQAHNLRFHLSKKHGHETPRRVRQDNPNPAAD